MTRSHILAAALLLALTAAACASGPTTRREQMAVADGGTASGTMGVTASGPPAGAVVAIGDAQLARDRDAYYEQRLREQEYELARQRAEIERLRRERGEPTTSDAGYEPPYSQPRGYYQDRYYDDRYSDDGNYAPY